MVLAKIAKRDAAHKVDLRHSLGERYWCFVLWYGLRSMRPIGAVGHNILPRGRYDA